MYQNFVLGAGLAGLLTGFYTDFVVIGKISNNWFYSNLFALGPQFLYCAPQVQRLLRDLDLSAHVEKICVGYYDGTIRQYSSDVSNTTFQQQYVLETRGMSTDLPSAMSDGQTEFYSYILEPYTDMPFKTILQALYSVLFERKHNAIINDNVKQVEPQSIILDSGQEINYQKIVNTIPLNIFNQIAKLNLDWDFSLRAKHFYQCQYNNKIDIEMKQRYCYVYAIHTNYTRKTYYPDYIVYETVNCINDSNIEGNHIIRKNENLKVQIVHNSSRFECVNNIPMIGRYAQWNHRVRIPSILDSIWQLAI